MRSDPPDQLFPPSEADAATLSELKRTLRRLKIIKQIDHTALSRGAALLPPLIERAATVEARHRDAADPDHPMTEIQRQMTEQNRQDGGRLLFQSSSPIAGYQAAHAVRICLETLQFGLNDITRSMGAESRQSTPNR